MINTQDERESKKQLLISGTMRSGTTLISSILNSNSDVFISVDVLTWFWKKCYSPYIDLADELLLDKVLYEIEPLARYYGTSYDRNLIKETVMRWGISYKSLHKALILSQGGSGKESLLGEKSTHSAEYYEPYLQEYPTGYIIHMVRDPRDVVASLKMMVKKQSKHIKESYRTIIRPKKLFSRFITQLVNAAGLKIYEEKAFFREYPERIHEYWKKSLDHTLDLMEKFPDNIRIVRYEDLVEDPAKTLPSILGWIDLDLEPQMLDYNALKDRQGKTWKANTSYKTSSITGFTTSQVGKYKQVLTEEERKRIYHDVEETALRFEYR